MRYDPVVAALVKERGPSHPDYAAVVLQEKVSALVREGRLNLRQPRGALLTQVRDILRNEGNRSAGDVTRHEPALFVAQPARPTSREDPQVVMDEICTRYQIDRAVLLGPSRRRSITSARFELFYQLRNKTSLSYQMIGKVAGGRHHATVLHGIGEWCRRNRLPHPDYMDAGSNSV